MPDTEAALDQRRPFLRRASHSAPRTTPRRCIDRLGRWMLGAWLLLSLAHGRSVRAAWIASSAFSRGINQSRSVTSSSSDLLHNMRRSSSPPEAVAEPTPTAAVVTASFRDRLQSRTVNAWVQQLSGETKENYQKSLLQSRLPLEEQTNTTKRPVFNGHYVLVAPTPLPHPRLVLYSPDVAERLLGFTKAHIQEADFLKFVSGDIRGIAKGDVAWATPYALSIMGTRYTNNCPFGTGDGYGDGRAIAIAELAVDGAEEPTASYELQLKGAGTTPFHRGADGRAVLRSSIREFLASEAMHFLGVPTTRALSLVVSATATSQRPWYRAPMMDSVDLGDPFASAAARPRSASLPTLDDPRLAQYSEAQKRQIIRQVRRQTKADPDILLAEPNAITCRVATSFTRIGHLDLFARRAVAASIQPSAAPYATDTLPWKELEQMIWHACYREYRDVAYTPYIATHDIAGAGCAFLEYSGQKIAHMVAEWIRVGFAQYVTLDRSSMRTIVSWLRCHLTYFDISFFFRGNFNADNCLVSGCTMDYGPFGFMEEYDPLFAKWTGSGQHFGFLNQPNAGYANYGVLVESVVPVIAAARGLDEHATLQAEFLETAQTIFQSQVDAVFRSKLGFLSHQEAADDVWETVEPLLRNSRVDYTIFFRELSYLVRDVPNILDASVSISAEELFSQLQGDDAARTGSSPFYETLTPDLHAQWLSWIEVWRSTLAKSSSDDAQDVVASRMLKTNPKYVLREWMLVEAYQNAAQDDESELFALYQLIQHPYDEGTTREVERYYRRAPEEALLAGGTAFMS
jgi:serine/tyrosine/threonine adenylyltransferase